MDEQNNVFIHLQENITRLHNEYREATKRYIEKISLYKENRFMELFTYSIILKREIDNVDMELKEKHNALSKQIALKYKYEEELLNLKSDSKNEYLKNYLLKNKQFIYTAIIFFFGSLLFALNNPSDYSYSLLKMSVFMLLSYLILTGNHKKNKLQRKKLNIESYIDSIKEDIYFLNDVKKMYTERYNAINLKLEELKPTKLDNETEEEYDNRIYSMYQEFENKHGVKVRKRINMNIRQLEE